ncbi:histidine kinase [Rossellomorea marisflavi]|uniref:Signal transduction histidine-protein kinase/phosphatase DegS n=1 Tax=Rossellomorea marisflavi TaxID=189381 RepID=A0A5D4RQ05_9BACI|nr:sensor histidine kinase [Rossellomorea marisflavi]KQU58396.1 histidine kinase [Bacillus sp. Leaf406]MBV6685574.1 sensor histidine kinase [Bacillus sp. JRC01]VXC48731.1 two-component sensor histidine kinase (DegU) [Bacillus sp. 349Y]MDW4528421.1 sensor histidine kinase [Rossellomorea marisflavi]TYS52471.1 histidine kinase [Rossellomorea marisflavi]
MSLKKIDTKILDGILEKMIDTVDESKGEIFQIGEQCRNDYQDLMQELLDVKNKVLKVIDEGDELHKRSRLARLRLSEVSKHFQTYSEDQVRDAYEKAHDFQMKLLMNRQQEKQLRDRRDELERRMRSLGETIDKAENLCSQISVVLNYLNSDLREVNEALEDAKQRQDFGLQIIEAQEDERKRVSREIHDGPAQMMANVLIRSDLIERVFREKTTDDAIKEIRDLKRMVRSALYEVRRIIYDLRPMALDDLGLVPTLKKYLSTIEEYNDKTSIQFINMGLDIRLPPKFEVALFRMVQESVQNSLKHAEATHIQVKVEVKKDNITVVIKDNGKGFDLHTQKTGSFGIMGMKERVDLLEGDITIDSKVGGGTVILIRVPLNM